MFERLTQLIAPHHCLFCGEEGSALCSDCRADQLNYRTPSCWRCNTTTPDGRSCSQCQPSTALCGVTAAYRLDEAMERVIYQLKYDGVRELAVQLGSELTTNLIDRRIDLVSFVPSDGPTLRRRGYNQAQLLAKSAGIQLHLPVRPTLLRIAHSPQVGKSRSERLDAVVGNFFVLGNQFKGKQILILDDVLTTGATLAECARILQAGGAKSVWGAVAARK